MWKDWLRGFVIRTSRFPAATSLYRRIYQLEASRVARHLLRVPGVHDVYLYGSLVREDFYPGLSDIDIAVEIDDDSPPVLRSVRNAAANCRGISPFHFDVSLYPVHASFRRNQLGAFFSGLRAVRHRHAHLDTTLSPAQLRAERLHYATQLYRKLYRAALGPAPALAHDLVLQNRLWRLEQLVEDLLEDAPYRSGFRPYDPLERRQHPFHEAFRRCLNQVESRIATMLRPLPSGTPLTLHPYVPFRAMPFGSPGDATTIDVPPYLSALLSRYSLSSAPAQDLLAREVARRHSFTCSQRLRRWVVQPPSNTERVRSWLDFWNRASTLLAADGSADTQRLVDSFQRKPSVDWIVAHFADLRDTFERPFRTS